MRNWTGKVILCLAAFGMAFLTGCQQKDLAGEYAQDRLDCQNLMSLHSWYHSAFMNDQEVNDIWAQKAKDVVWAQNSGFWLGLDRVKESYGAPMKDKSVTAGHFQMHTVTTGVVVVAQDRQTAKGIFYTPGMVGSSDSGQWMWERYGVDFIREDGVWKIWHLHVYSDFAAQMGKDMGAGGPGGGAAGGAPGAAQGGQVKAEHFGPESMTKAGAPGGQGAPGGGAPGGGGEGTCPNGGRMAAPGLCLSAEALTPSYSAKVGYKELSKDTIPLLVPRPPVPYKTFSETFSYADPDEYANALAAVKKQQ
jgi:hypothetical protein